MEKQEISWREKVSECRGSGKTAKEWCKEKGIIYSTYMCWAAKVNKEDKNREIEKPESNRRQWASVQVTEPAEEKGVKEILLTCGKWNILVTEHTALSLLETVLSAVNRIC